jgi:hypothetical protein
MLSRRGVVSGIGGVIASVFGAKKLVAEVYTKDEVDGIISASASTPGNGITPPILAEDLPAAHDRLALPAIRRRLRMMPDLYDYGSPSDASAAISAATADMAAHGLRKCLVPAGLWRLAAPVAFDRGYVFEGEDRSASVFRVEHAGHGFMFSGINGGGGGLRAVSVQKHYGTSGGASVYAAANANGTAPDGLILEELWLTYTSAAVWDYGVVLHGGNRNPVSGLQGLRDLAVERVVTFGTRYQAIYALNVRAAHFSQVLCNGVGGNSNIAILGNSPNQNDVSNGVTFDGVIFGQLLLNNTVGLSGNCLPQGGFSKGGGISNCKLLVPSPYWDIGPSPGVGAGLELV